MFLELSMRTALRLILAAALIIIFAAQAHAYGSGGGSSSGGEGNGGEMKDNQKQTILKLSPEEYIRHFGTKEQKAQFKKLTLKKYENMERDAQDDIDLIKRQMRLLKKAADVADDSVDPNSDFEVDRLKRQYRDMKMKLRKAFVERQLAQMGLKKKGNVLSQLEMDRYRQAADKLAHEKFDEDTKKLTEEMDKIFKDSQKEADERDRELIAAHIVKYGAMAGMTAATAPALTVVGGGSIAGMSTAQAKAIVMFAAKLDVVSAVVPTAVGSYQDKHSPMEALLRSLSAASVQVLSAKVVGGVVSESKEEAINKLISFVSSNIADQAGSKTQETFDKNNALEKTARKTRKTSVTNRPKTSVMGPKTSVTGPRTSITNRPKTTLSAPRTTFRGPSGWM